MTTQLIPFCKAQFDMVMAYQARKHRHVLSQLEMVKLHVMTDVFHVLETGRPVIGGTMERWKHGAVVKPAYNRIRHWAHVWDEDPARQPEHFEIVGKKRNVFLYKPTMEVESDDFSASELRAMDRAWEIVMGKKGGRDFFHRTDSFMGLAWNRTGDKEPISWEQIIKAREEINPSSEDHSLARQFISA